MIFFVPLSQIRTYYETIVNYMKSFKSTAGFICAGLMLTACGQQNKNETTMDFTDDVQVAHDGQQPDE